MTDRYKTYLDHFLLIFIAGIFLIVSGCNSGTDNEYVDDTGKSLEIIKIGRLICGGHLPLAVVEKKYQDQIESFHLQTVQNHDWNDVVEDMRSGKLAGTFMLSPLAMNLIHNGFPGKIVMVSNRNGNGFVLADKIRSIDELKKIKTIIAVPHVFSQHNVLLHILIQEYKIPVENVSVVGMPPRDMIGSLRKGEIDGFVVGEPEANKSVELGVGWMAAISPAIWENHMDHVFLASNKFIDEKPRQLQELVNKLLQAGIFIEKNPHEAARMGEDYTGSPAFIFEKVLTDPPDWIDYYDMTPRKSDVMTMAEKLVEMNLWNNNHIDNPEQYIDMRFITRAIKLNESK